MESERIVAITTTDRASIALPEQVMDVYMDCAIKTTARTFFESDVKSIVERNYDNRMNFMNTLFSTVDADEEWRYQFRSFSNAALSYDPVYVHGRLLETENDMQIFKEDLLAMVKCFFAFSDSEPSALEYVDVELEVWHRLSEKYRIDKSDLVDIAWTYPYLSLMVLKVFSALERPVGMNMLWDYPGFRPELRFMGLLGIVPRHGQFGGFVKVLLHHAVLQVEKGLYQNSIIEDIEKSKGHILRDILGLARVIYHTDVSETCTREEFFQCLEITVENMTSWTVTFNKQYPEFWDIHIKYFEQTE